VNVQHKNSDVKNEEEVDNCSEVEYEESVVSQQDKGPRSKEETGKEEIQATEGTRRKRKGILDKSTKEQSAKKTAHSFFSKYSN
jgi:hypothetical protein